MYTYDAHEDVNIYTTKNKFKSSTIRDELSKNSNFNRFLSKRYLGGDKEWKIAEAQQGRSSATNKLKYI